MIDLSSTKGALTTLTFTRVKKLKSLSEITKPLFNAFVKQGTADIAYFKKRIL